MISCMYCEQPPMVAELICHRCYVEIKRLEGEKC